MEVVAGLNSCEQSFDCMVDELADIRKALWALVVVQAGSIEKAEDAFRRGVIARDRLAARRPLLEGGDTNER